MLLLLTQPKLPLPYRTYSRTYHIYRLFIIILRMTKFPPNFVNMKNVNLSLHISSRRVHCVLGIHISPAFSLLGIPSRLASGLTWRSVARRSVARRTVATAFGLPGVRSPRRTVAWRSVAVPTKATFI